MLSHTTLEQSWGTSQEQKRWLTWKEGTIYKVEEKLRQSISLQEVHAEVAQARCGLVFRHEDQIVNRP